MESIVSLTCRQASGLRSMPKPSPRSLTTQAKKTGKKESKKENVTQKANIYTATTVIPSRHSQTPQKTGSQRRSKREERSTDDVPLLREAARMRAATTTGSTRMKTIRIKYIHSTVQLRDTVQYEDNVKENTYTLQYKRRYTVQVQRHYKEIYTYVTIQKNRYSPSTNKNTYNFRSKNEMQYEGTYVYLTMQRGDAV
jgi:hypothetical protein